MRMITVRDMLSVEQILDVLRIWESYHRREFHQRVIDEVLQPNIDDINRRLGQENEVEFLAYTLEYACGQIT